MAQTYSPESLGIKAPAGGFQQGGWYSGRQYWGGVLSDPGVINPLSNQTGAGQAVSAEVNAASAAAQGQTPQQMDAYLQQQRATQPTTAVPTAVSPMGAGGLPSGATGLGGTGTGLSPTATIDLPTMYQNLYKNAGIAELEQQMSDKQKTLTETKAKNNDNPFLSEATRFGREAKVQKLFDEQTANLQKDIATKKADIQIQLDLQTKQFDINSQAAKDALSQFNTLLQAGAYDNASGDDIAAATRATGISSNMISAAVAANKDKNTKTEIKYSEDNNGNVTAVVINSKTGEVIAKNDLGAIGTASKTGGNANIGSTEYKAQATSDLSQFLNGRKDSWGHVGQADWNAALAAFMADALGTTADFQKAYASYADYNLDPVNFQRVYGFAKP